MLTNFWFYLKTDFRRLYEYKIFPIMIVISFLLALAVGFFPSLNAANALYLAVFILPVIVFSFVLHTEVRSHDFPPQTKETANPFSVLMAKVTAATVVQLIPLGFIMLAMALIRHIEINYLVLALAYLLGVVGHIIIGLSLSIISKSDKLLPLSYVVYIIVFCAGPIFFSNGLVPLKFQYYLVFSPAYLSGVLIDNIVAQAAYSPVWLILLSVFLQVAYSFILLRFVIHPFFKVYLAEFSQTKHSDMFSGGDDK